MQGDILTTLGDGTDLPALPAELLLRLDATPGARTR